MELSLNLFNSIIAFGMLQSFIFGIYLCIKSKSKGPQFYLGITVLLLSLYLLWVLKYDMGIQKSIPGLQFLPILFISGIGPSFYIYLRFLIKRPLSKSKIRLLFVPLAIEFVFYNATTIIYWINHWDHNALNGFERFWVVNAIAIQHILGLSISGLFLFKSYKLVSGVKLLLTHNRIRSLLICFIGLWSIWCVFVLYDTYFYSFTFPPSKFYVFYILFAVLTYTIGFYGFKINNDTISRLSFIDAENTEKQIVTAEMQVIFEDIKAFMQSSKCYTNSDISLSSFSKQLDLHPNKVSAVINTITKSSFRDFINAYRLEAFKSQIDSYDFESKTIIGLAYDVGFNSKSSFNRAFKKFNDVSPSEYIQKKKTPS